jgi:hypothetical protein
MLHSYPFQYQVAARNKEYDLQIVDDLQDALKNHYQSTINSCASILVFTTGFCKAIDSIVTIPRVSA